MKIQNGEEFRSVRMWKNEIAAGNRSEATNLYYDNKIKFGICDFVIVTEVRFARNTSMIQPNHKLCHDLFSLYVETRSKARKKMFSTRIPIAMVSYQLELILSAELRPKYLYESTGTAF